MKNLVKKNYVHAHDSVNLLLVDRVMEDFFKLVFEDEGVSIKLGYPKAEFQHPSIFINQISGSCEEFLGNYMKGDRRDEQKLEIIRQYTADGAIDGKTTNITDERWFERNKGYMVRGSVKVTTFNDNRDAIDKLSEQTLSALLFNMQDYLTDITRYGAALEHDNPHCRIKWNGIFPKFHEQLGGVKNIYSVTFDLTITYFVRIKQKYTYLTDIEVTQTAKEEQTGEVVAVHHQDI